MPDTQTGIFYGVDREEYDAIRAANQSSLKLLARSAKYARHKLDNPETTEPMAFGTAVHVATLEAEDFPARYHVMPKVDRRTTVGKQAYADALNAAEGKIILPETGKLSYDYACQMGEALHKHPDIHRLFERGPEREAMLVWRDEVTGLLCKGLVDALIDDKWATLGDLKTSRNCSEDFMSRELYDRGYHVQGAFYLGGYRTITGKTDANFVLAVVENEPPFDCALYPIGEKSLTLGGIEVRRYLETWKQCSETGKWPGVPQRPIELDVPAYRLKELSK